MNEMKEKGKGFFKEFKEFISRGNVMDMAVGVIIGSAFSNITTSLINDIIMPILGIFTNSISFAELSVNVGDAAVITYGNFIQAVLNFIVMAFVVFCIVKLMNSFHRKKDAQPEPPPAPPEPTKEEVLLSEIRDLLKEQAAGKNK